MPVEGALHQPEEGAVVFLKVGAELLEHSAVNSRMRSSLRLVQTALSAITADAVKPFGLIEVEVGGYYPGWQVKEALHPLKLWEGITDQSVTVYYVYLF